MTVIVRPLSAGAARLRGFATRIGWELMNSDSSTSVRNSIQDGYIIRAVKTGGRVIVTILEPQGVMTAFGDPIFVPPPAYGSVPTSTLTQVNYTGPSGDMFDPRVLPRPLPLTEPLAPTGKPKVYRYEADEETGAQPTMHVLGTPPSAAATLNWFVRGRMWEGERGVYCCSHLSTAAPGDSVTEAPKWVRIDYQPCGVGDGRRGLIMSEAYLATLAPGYVLFIDNGSNDNAVPDSHGCEDGDNVVVSFQVQQRRYPGRADGNDAYIAAVLTICLNMKTGALVWHNLFEFDNASAPAFKLEIGPYTSPGSLVTRDIWPTISLDKIVVERVLVPDAEPKFFVGFYLRCRRGFKWEPSFGTDPDWYFDRWFTSVCVLEVSATSVTDTYYSQDCWAGTPSPGIALVGADPLVGTRPISTAVDLLGGLPVFWVEVYDRIDYDEADTDFVTFLFPSHEAEYQRLYIGTTLVATAAASGICGAAVFAFVSRPSFKLVAQNRSRTKTSENTLATIWRRFTVEIREVVAIVRGVGASVSEPLLGTGISGPRTGGLTLTCPQREIRNEFDEVITQPVLIAAAPGGAYVEGVETATISVKRGGGGWVVYPAVGYAVGGVSYLGNPLNTQKYGHMYEGL